MKQLLIGDIEKEYGVDFGECRSDKKLSTYLKEQGYPSLARVLTTIGNKKNENNLQGNKDNVKTF